MQSRKFCLGSYSPGLCGSLLLFPCLLSAEVSQVSIQQQLHQQTEVIEQLKQRITQLEASDDKSEMNAELELSGFFDVTAHTTDNSDHPFDLGSFELDLQFDPSENISVSSALVWDGDVSEVAVALLDYHVSSHHVPTRGSLFGETGYHIQLGRFDIPFGLDYEYFASVDRPNITAPLTTDYLQKGGFNGDGIRAYGRAGQLDYAAYITNSLLADDGASAGWRIGFFPGRDPYSLHKNTSSGDLIMGFSWLYDADEDENRRNLLKSVDVNYSYGAVQFLFEYMVLENILDLDESGYNARFIFDLEFISLFMGYGEWKPDYTSVADEKDETVLYRVEKLNRFTIGVNYAFDDYLQMKFEYFTHLDTEVELPDFEDERFTFQLVANF